VDIEPLKKWIGRQDVVDDVIVTVPSGALAATLDRSDSPANGDALPPLWHWLYFLPLHLQSQLASDGHAKRGEFLPPIPLPRRMFAGSRLRFAAPLRLGERARRITTVSDIKLKQGRTGPLLFLLLTTEIDSPSGRAITEQQDIVYREQPRASEPPRQNRRSGRTPTWQRELRPDILLLFRYSALIFNAHRIHYDRPYATQREGYPGLVVHGQLLATLLADLVARHSTRTITAFRFRSTAALFDTAPLRLCGHPADDHVDLWAEDLDGNVAMEAQAELS
jgi:3-methylfumaryl-CoA hydratase